MEIENNELPLNDTESMLTTMGIIGDKVGSGKSYVVISLISCPVKFPPNHSHYKFFADNHVCIVKRSFRTYVKTSVIIIPHNLCKQWETYIHEFNPSLKCLIVNKNNRIGKTDWEAYDVVLVTCTMYNNFVTYNTDTTFARVFYDEADSVRLPNCKKLSAMFYWFVTASYENLINPFGAYAMNAELGKHVEHCYGLKHNGFIKDLFSTMFNSKNIAKLLVIKNEDEFVDRSMCLPLVNSEIVECKTPYTINVLSNIVDKEVIRCLNANDVKKAMQCIHPSQRSNESNIIDICLDNFKKNLKNTILQIEFTKMMEYDTETQRQDELKKLEMSKTDLENKMAAITSRVQKVDKCCICLEENVNQRTVIDCCSNTFCFQCISVWLAKNPSCPLCKCPEKSIRDLLIIEGSSSDEEVDLQRPGSPHPTIQKTNNKVSNLVNILKMDRTKKTLVFSQYDETFEAVVYALREARITWAFLKGPCMTVVNTIEKFRNGQVNVLLINPEHYGSGLNLECTTDVIMFHKLDTEMEKQVIGRAYRFGRTMPLNVWYLLHANEMPIV